MTKHIKTSLLLLCLLGLGLLLSPAPITGRASKSNFIYMPVIQKTVATWIGPEGGNIVALVIDPVQPQVMYAGTWGAGVYKSTDGGTTWIVSSQGLGNLYINSLAIDSLHPEIIFAGSYKSGIYRTTDAGAHWAPTNTGIQDQAIVYSIAVHPVKANLVFASTRGISNNGSYPWKGILYVSQDGGLTWTPSLYNVPVESQQDWVYSIDIDKAAPNLIYAATHEYGIYRSNDYGASWERVINGLNDWSGRAVVSDPVNGIIYSGFWHTGGVYSSSDRGDHWSLANPSIGGKKVYSMTIDPIHPKTIYLGTFTDGLIRTTDGFSNFDVVGPVGDKFYTVAVSPKNDQNIFCGTVGDGIWASKDGGATWSSGNLGLKTTSVPSILFYQDQIYTSIYGQGVLSMPVSGTVWSPVNNNLADHFLNAIVQDPIHPNLIYALDDFTGIYRMDLNTNSGWTNISVQLPSGSNMVTSNHSSSQPDLPGMMELADGFDILPGSISQVQTNSLFALAIAPSNPSTMYLGLENFGVYVSVDAGASWNSSGINGQYISNLVVDPRSDQTVYAVTMGKNYIMSSTDRGQNWTRTDLPVAAVNQIALSPNNPDLLFAGTSSGLYKKNINSGEGWSLVGLSSEPVNTIAFYPGDPAHLLVGTENGVYQSNDSGATWISSPVELQGISVQTIVFDPKRPTNAYFGTRARGIMHIPSH